MTELILAGRFEIPDLTANVLGQGAMGTVYRGTDRQTGHTVAIKALRPEITLHGPELVTRFQREGDALRQLNHPNIVAIITAIHENGQHYLVMEYVGDQSLAALLHPGPLPIVQAVAICPDLSDALTRAHRLGIIHRDLKPANVLLAEDGTPRLSDFGVAHFSDKPSLTETGLLVGTFDYLSPEACQGQPIDERSDIWGLGVILFEMLTGRRPFSGQHIADTLQAILTEPTPPLAKYCPAAPDSLSDLVYRMLVKDRQARLPSARLAGLELENILIELTGSTPTGRKKATPLTPTTPVPVATIPVPEVAQAQYHNLPAQSTPFIGREGALAEIHRLLQEATARLITVLGPGGTGKTRLALEIGGRLAGPENPALMPDRPVLSPPLPPAEGHFKAIHFVSLAPLTEPDDIPAAVAAAIQLRLEEDGSDPLTQLAAFFSGQTSLLILDNYEHLLEGAHFAGELLAVAPTLTILATSRIRLNLTGETVYLLSGMDFPDWETPDDAMAYSAVQLFLQSARRAQPGYELEADDLKYVARICRLSQGLPLAIILAAAWVNVLNLKEIAEEIGRGLDFLDSNIRDLPERHHSIRAVFNSSWDLLDLDSQDTFMKLAVFRGGFSRRAAQEVTGAALRTLLGLVNNSLLLREPDGRFLIHELLRQYSAEKLGESGQTEPIRDAHSAYYAAAMDRRLPDLIGRRLPEALNDIAIDYENMRATWQWAIKRRNYEAIGQITESLYWYTVMHSRYVEGDALLRQAFDGLAPLPGEEPHPTWSRLLIFYRMFAREQFAGAEEWLDQGIAEARKRNDRKWLVLGFQHLANLQLNMGQGESEALETAEKNYLASLEAAEGLPYYQAHTRFWLGNAYMNQFRWSEGRLQLNLAIEQCRELGNIGLAADALSTLAFFAVLDGYYDSAQVSIEEADLYRVQVGDWAGIAISRATLGHLALLHGEIDKAEEWARRSLEMYTGAGFAIVPLLDYAVLACISWVQGELEQSMEAAERSLSYSNNNAGLYEALAQLALVGSAIGRDDLEMAQEILHTQLVAILSTLEGITTRAETTEFWAVLMPAMPIIVFMLNQLDHQRLAIRFLVFCRQHRAAVPGWWDHFVLLPAVETELAKAYPQTFNPQLWQVPIDWTFAQAVREMVDCFSSESKQKQPSSS